MIKSGSVVNIVFEDGEEMRGAVVVFTPVQSGDCYCVKSANGLEHHIMRFIIMSECAPEAMEASNTSANTAKPPSAN